MLDSLTASRRQLINFGSNFNEEKISLKGELRVLMQPNAKASDCDSNQLNC